MKNKSVLFLLIAGILLIGFGVLYSTPQKSKEPTYITLQVNYKNVDDSTLHYMFLITKETSLNHYEVLTQEYFDKECPIIISEIFDYNSIK